MGLNMASKIRLGEKQLPDIYRYLPHACKKLGIAEPDFYLEMNPSPNAYTYGDSRVFVTVTFGLLEYLDEDEIQAVVAHECGHIACRHTLYGTMARMLIDYGLRGIGLAGKALLPAIWALLYWYRRSEFSTDRAAAAVLGGADSIMETMIRLSGGPKSITEKVDVDLYAQQAEEYHDFQESSWWDKMLQGFQIMWMSHPLAAVRVREIRSWCGQDRFRQIVESFEARSNGDACPSCSRFVSGQWKFCQHCGAALQTQASGKENS